MNKKQLVAKMAEKTGLTLTSSAKALDAFVESVTEALKDGDGLQLVGFCTMQVKEKPARDGINPATGKKIKIAAKKTVKIKAGAALEEAIK